MYSGISDKSIYEDFKKKARIDAEEVKKDNIADTNKMLCTLANVVLPVVFERTLEDKDDRINIGVFSLPHQVLDDVKGMEGYKKVHKLCKENDLCVEIKFSEGAVVVDVSEKSKQDILDDYDYNRDNYDVAAGFGESKILSLVVDPARKYNESADKYDPLKDRMMLSFYKSPDLTKEPMFF